MEKVIRNGQVAVIYSGDFGAGWYSWNPEYPEILFDPNIVHFIENKEWDKLFSYVTLRYPEIHPSKSCISDLRIQWLPEGTEFRITEYDGSEDIEVRKDVEWITA
jgi:hypothetical protein